MEQCDVVVVGAGFSGLYAVHRLLKQGSVICFEAGSGVGGTWYWNRYPGARVDVESVQYSYGFDDDLQQDWHWPEHFSAQPDLEKYLNHVADRFQLRPHIRLSNRVTSLRFDETENRWHVRSAKGDHVVCRYVVSATGVLYAASAPDWPGKDEFKGIVVHTAQWPREGLDLVGKRIGIVGTGSTAIQLAPVAAEQAAHVFVFQRTPAFSIPSINRPMDPEYESDWKRHYPERRKQAMDFWAAAIVEYPSTVSIHDVTPAERERILEECWYSRNAFQVMLAFPDIMTDRAGNEYVAEFARRKIREIVKEPAVAELLCPKDYPFGGKRLCVDTGYFQMYNRDNVSLVNVKDNPIIGFTPTGLETADGSNVDLDMVIMATGFDAFTGSLARIDITGAGGVTLSEKWRDGATSYLGMAIAGFPNLFLVHGPLSMAAQAQMIASSEWQIDWIAARIAELDSEGYVRVEATAEAETEWAREVEENSRSYVQRMTDSWYNGANIEGKARQWLIYLGGGWPAYTKACNDAVKEGYRGFLRG